MNMDQRWREELFSLYKKGSWVTIGNHTVKDNGFGLLVLYVTANSSKQNDCKDNLREWSNHLLLESSKIFWFSLRACSHLQSVTAFARHLETKLCYKIWEWRRYTRNRKKIAFLEATA